MPGPRARKSVAEDLEAVLTKIEDWHQGSIRDLRYGIFATGIRPVFAVLSLLLCAVAARPDEPIVIGISAA